jgi:Zn finger protein HypA/HybF involved in hydrogenase expression
MTTHRPKCFYCRAVCDEQDLVGIGNTGKRYYQCPKCKAEDLEVARQDEIGKQIRRQLERRWQARQA